MIEITQGSSPIVLAFPYSGTDVPPEIWETLNERGQALADTDWHIDRLYADLGLDLTRVRTPIHRYAIDVNCAPDGQSVSSGQITTGLCPLTDFEGLSIYQEGMAPDANEIARRKALYYDPYHAALSAELERIRAKYGVALLYDCHAIRSSIPVFCDGNLPDFNIGTNSSSSCALSVEKSVYTRCRASGQSTALNDHFKGDWTTRRYGQPTKNIHAIEMKLAQCTYMQEHPPWHYREDKADRLRPILYRILSDLVELVHERLAGCSGRAGGR